MKSDKKISSAKKKTTRLKNSSPEKSAVKKPAAIQAKTKTSAASSKTKPAAKKVADFVGGAIKTTKKGAIKIKEVAEKAERKVRTTAARSAPKLKVSSKSATPISEQKPAARAKKPLAIPPILLEGDQASAPSASGPGQRYSLGPSAPSEQFSVSQELPESYGTKRLLILARDPHWIYAHWDFSREQLREHNALSADGHLVLRVYQNEISGSPLSETHVHPESRNWFVHVGQGGTKFLAELGYYDRSGNWVRVTTSGATITPPDALSEDTSVRFATIPVDVPFEELLEIVKAAVSEHVPLAEAIQQLRADGFKKLPEPSKWASTPWTEQQQRVLASVVTMDSVRRLWIGSLEITELVRRHLRQETASISAAQIQMPSSISLASLSSPFGGAERRKGFWFNVNAELIIYGATEPDAKVTIGDREIKLRPDGTFSYRFILPDGNYDLPAQATSADGDDTRAAHLKFSRKTEYRGEVGTHPQDPGMKAPRVENLS